MPIIIKEKYLFSAETPWNIFAKYTSRVYLCHDRVKIRREGRVGDIPEEVTVYFDQIASITYTKDTNYMLSYIAFTGLSNAKAQSISGFNVGDMMFAGSSLNPWSDPYGIVFKMGLYDKMKPYYKKMVEAFEKYKSSHSTPSVQSVVMGESSMDKLKKLKELKELDIITEEEYQEKRAKILSEI